MILNHITGVQFSLCVPYLKERISVIDKPSSEPDGYYDEDMGEDEEIDLSFLDEEK